MSTTLTNGLKLPDKGSVDWYADMQNNYAILNGAVGTVAEHTTQIAGKAPAVHTHTKADITDFPAYGNTAGTICEGNDSRLSDARTPVAHVHGSITNDGKVGTTANLPLITGTGGAVQAGSFGNAANTFCEGNDSRLSDARTPVSHTHTKSDVTDLLNSNFIPSVNNSYNLGSSEYNWNNVYCSAIYSPAIINSNNAASPSDSSVSSIVALRSIITYTSGDPDAIARLNFRLMGTGEKSLYPHESNQYYFGLASRQWSNSYIQHGYFTGIQQGDEYSANARTNLTLTANQDSSNVSGLLVDSFRSNTTQGQATHSLGFEMKEDSVRYSGCRMHWKYDSNANKYIFALCPAKQGTNQPASFDLGNASYYWDTINGINPEALSLPDLDNTHRWSLDTTNWVLDGSSNNTFTPNFSGWLNIRIPDAAGNYIIMQSGSITVSNQGTGALASTITKPLSLLIPVIEGVSGLIRVNAASIIGFFYPALGNPIKTIQPSS